MWTLLIHWDDTNYPFKTSNMTPQQWSNTVKEHYKGRNHHQLTRQALNENTIILDSEHDPRRLLFLEAIYITVKQPSINIQTENLQILPTLKRRKSNQRGDLVDKISRT